jgi:hypothetical protein
MNDKLNMTDDVVPYADSLCELIGWVPAALFYGAANFLALYTLL